MVPRRSDRTARDEAFVRSLYEQHGGALLAYAIRVMGDRMAAEDVLQETLLRAWRHSATLDESAGSIRGWLFTVARNVMTDAARARAARPREVAQTPELTPTIRDHADTVVDSVVALEALARLSYEQRSVLVQIYLEGRSVAEAAARLGIPPGTVKSRTHNAMKALRRMLIGPAALAEEVA
jgi:RNA polymerase sigma-70 factor (ECF subfamily)